MRMQRNCCRRDCWSVTIPLVGWRGRISNKKLKLIYLSKQRDGRENSMQCSFSAFKWPSCARECLNKQEIPPWMAELMSKNFRLIIDPLMWTAVECEKLNSFLSSIPITHRVFRWRQKNRRRLIAMWPNWTSSAVHAAEMLPINFGSSLLLAVIFGAISTLHSHTNSHFIWLPPSPHRAPRRHTQFPLFLARAREFLADKFFFFGFVLET